MFNVKNIIYIICNHIVKIKIKIKFNFKKLENGEIK